MKHVSGISINLRIRNCEDRTLQVTFPVDQALSEYNWFDQWRHRA